MALSTVLRHKECDVKTVQKPLEDSLLSVRTYKDTVKEMGVSQIERQQHSW